MVVVSLTDEMNMEKKLLEVSDELGFPLIVINDEDIYCSTLFMK